jgi:hypothetical protein
MNSFVCAHLSTDHDGEAMPAMACHFVYAGKYYKHNLFCAFLNPKNVKDLIKLAMIWAL